jgi:hypothetical protein
MKKTIRCVYSCKKISYSLLFFKRAFCEATPYLGSLAPHVLFQVKNVYK